MMQTCNSLEARSVDPGAASDRLAGAVARVLAACLAVEAIAVVVMLAVVGGVVARPAEPDRQADPVVRIEPDQQADPVVRIEPDQQESPADLTGNDTESFLRAWRRSLETDHGASGTLTRIRLSDDTLYSSTWPAQAELGPDVAAVDWIYHHTHLGNRQLTQIGDVATVIDPINGRRTCLRQSQGFACSPDDGAVGATAAMAVVEGAVSGPAATHRITAIDPAPIRAAHPDLPPDIECWEARSSSDGVGQRWGRRAQFCFDAPTGAAVFRRVLGTTRLEALVVDRVTRSVSLADLDPR